MDQNKAQTLDDILHLLIVGALTAGSLYIKNPASQAQAGVFANLLTTVLLPMADARLNPKPATSSTFLPEQSAIAQK